VEHRLRVFENRVLRRTFGAKRVEVVGGWKRLYEELQRLYASKNTIRVIKSRKMVWAGNAARMEEMRNAYKISTGKPEGNRPLGRTGCRWEEFIVMDLRDIRWKGVNWIHLAQWSALLNKVMNLRVP
jgi:hypothetical protein